METQQPSSFPPSPIQAPISPCHSNKRLIVLLLVLIFLFLTVLGMFTYQAYQSNQQISKTSPIAQQAKIPSRVPDEVEWKTYTYSVISSAGDQISFEYPPDLQLKSLGSFQAASFVNTAILKKGEETFMFIGYYPNPERKNLTEVDKESTMEPNEFFPNGVSSQLMSPENKQITLNSGIIAYVQEGYCQPSVCTRYIIPIEQVVFDVQVYPLSSTEIISEATILEILSTFNFIHEEETPEYQEKKDKYITLTGPDSDQVRIGENYTITWDQKGLDHWGNQVLLCLRAYYGNQKILPANEKWQNTMCNTYTGYGEKGESYFIATTKLTDNKYVWSVPHDFLTRFELSPTYFTLHALVIDALPSDGRTEWAGLIDSDDSDSYFYIIAQ